VGGSLDSFTDIVFTGQEGLEVNYLASDLNVLSGWLNVEPKTSSTESLGSDLQIVSMKLQLPYVFDEAIEPDLPILSGILQVEPAYDLDESIGADLSIDGGELS
jgi:hypothetical protein